MYTITHGSAIKLNRVARRETNIILLESNNKSKESSVTTMSSNPQPPTFSNAAAKGAPKGKARRGAAQEHHHQEEDEGIKELRDYNTHRQNILGLNDPGTENGNIETNPKYYYQNPPEHEDIKGFKPFDLDTWWGARIYEDLKAKK